MKALLLALPLSALALVACLGDEALERREFQCPSREVFTGIPSDGSTPQASVSAYMERRCGTLDCHGSPQRWLRLYGRYSLRLDTNIPGGAATTRDELLANYDAVCTLEPDKTSQAVQDFGASADKLIFIQKARGIEGHKGGTVAPQGSPGDRCMMGWLTQGSLQDVAADCQAAIDLLE